MPLPMVAAAGLEAGGKILDAIGQAKQRKADELARQQKMAADQRTQNRDMALTDEDRSYKRAQQSALNPVRGQIYGAMLNRMGTPMPQGGRGGISLAGNPAVSRMMNPNAFKAVAPVQVAKAAQNDGTSYGDQTKNPEYIRMQADIDAAQAFVAKHGHGRGERDKLQQAMNARFGGYR
jgi:hypothetical protein